MRRWLLRGAVAGAVLGAGGVALVLGSGEAPEASEVSVPASGRAATLALSPVRSVVTAGQRTATLSYTLGNVGDLPRTYAISSAELSDRGRVEPDGASSAGRWAVPVRSRVRVPAHEAVQAKVRVQVPPDRGADERRIGVTFTDTTPARGGSVGVRAQVTTSVYVEGSGPAEYDARLRDLDLPLLSHKSVQVSATLVNHGTTTVVPGAPSQGIVGTLSRGDPFSLSGAVAVPGSRVSVSGRASDLPFACWCQVRVSAPDNRGGTTTVAGRTLVMPWPQVGLVALLVLGVAGVVRVRRPAAAPSPVSGSPLDATAVDPTPSGGPSSAHPSHRGPDRRSAKGHRTRARRRGRSTPHGDQGRHRAPPESPETPAAGPLTRRHAVR